MKYLVTIQHCLQYTIEIFADDDNRAERQALYFFEGYREKFKLHDSDYMVTEVDEIGDQK